MKPSRIAVALLGAAAALTLAACASTTDGRGARGSAAATGGVPPGSAPASVAPSTSANSMPSDAKGLYTLMLDGVASVTTAHLDMTISAAGQALTMSGDERLHNGKVTAMKIEEKVPGVADTIEIIVVGGKIYAKVPSTLNTTGKPYLLISESSGNAQVRQLAESINSSLTTASVNGYAVFAQAADSLKLAGTESRNGVRATHYTMVMNPSKLPPDYPSKQELLASGVDTIPIELYVDAHGRPVEIGEHFTVKGQTVDTKATFSGYNAPVEITAPPASEVGTE